jgi:hypothetical protein
MSVEVGIGSKVEFASALASAKSMSAITNASSAVATLEASHGVSVGDYIVITTSGWSRLQGRVCRVSAVDTNDVTLEGVDTSDTALYPAGQGAGTVQEVTWTEISQIAGIQPSGGEQQFADASFLSDADDEQVPANRTAVVYAFPIHDDPALSWYSSFRAACAAGLRPIRLTSAAGKITLLNGYWSFGELPQISRTETTKVGATFTGSRRTLIRYAS